MKLLFFAFSLLFFEIFTITINKTEVHQCYKGYFLQKNKKTCIRIPDFICKKQPSPNHFMFGECDEALIRKCPIEKCAKKGVFFESLCACVTKSSKIRIERNFHYRKSKKIFIEQYNQYLGVNSRIDQCAIGYKINEQECVKSVAKNSCKNKCRPGFETIFNNCFCKKKPKCPIKRCKRGYTMAKCSCVKNLSIIKKMLKSMHLMRKKQHKAVKDAKEKIRSKNNKISAKKRFFNQRRKIQTKETIAKVKKAQTKINAKKKKINKVVSTNRNEIKKKQKKNAGIAQTKKKIKKNDFDTKKEKKNVKRSKKKSGINLNRPSEHSGGWNKSKRTIVINSQKPVIAYIRTKNQGIQINSGSGDAQSFSKMNQKIADFKKKIQKQEDLSKNPESTTSSTIKKCKFGFFLDHSENKCKYLPADKCTNKCPDGLYPIPGLCTCTTKIECPIERCQAKFYLDDKCKCVKGKKQQSAKEKFEALFSRFTASNGFSDKFDSNSFNTDLKNNLDFLLENYEV